MTSPEMQLSVSEHPATVESKSPLMEGWGSRKKEPITLPDKQTISVRSETQKRALRLLINAFNEEKPFVTFEEFLDFDVANRAILNRAQKFSSVSRTIRSLKDNETLIGSGWNIQSITVTGKGVETRPKGYTLTKDQAQKTDAPELILQSFLEDNTVLKQLVTDEPGKIFILQKARRQINSLDQQEKIIFLEKTFAILSDSDPNPNQQNQRDAALDLLRSMNLAGVNKEGLTKAYVEAVSNLREGLNQDSDPYGEIDALLEAGKTIAPFIKKRGPITQSWNRVANTFTGADHDKILDDIEEIRQLIPKTLSEFDTNVLIRIEKGQRNKKIADEFGVPLSSIQQSVRRIINKGMMIPRESEKMPTKQENNLMMASNDTETFPSDMGSV